MLARTWLTAMTGGYVVPNLVGPAAGHHTNDRATASFEKALAAKPGAAVPMLGLGKSAFSSGDIKAALQYFKRVVAQAPGPPEAAEAAAFIAEIEKLPPPGV
jgi:Tfp pilus assembly protein PilF